MSGVLCVWAADLPESSEQWYEDEFIPEMMSRHSDRVLLSEIVETPLDKDLEGVATNDAPWKSMAVYEVDDVQKSTEATYDESNHPAMDGPLKGSRFDVRTYELIKVWQGDEQWNCDAADVASLLFFEWQPRAGREREVLEFYESEIGPLFSMAPEILRLRWFKIKNAITLKKDAFSTLKEEDLHTYTAIAEMNCEEWPWGEIFALNQLPQWAEYFEDQKAVRWQASHHVVKRSYPAAENNDSSDACIAR
ncbi:hypothetical protein C7974DRAFT_53882 [Boeremia exigua]|uniref:uncharacterized protein n=1 Tax=Boeremia exigua TaxID=749465 RepID=UPI001E8D15A6|nr:uncharacterized protein C7974DRAFT_53882 [Boeremia exigua]KAH6616895.1 hypothetical protein C7974DRAFT_53882 [Boeremia exigua]